MSEQPRAILVACGREIGARDIENIKEVVGLCSGLSQEELAHTICEHLSLVTASGRHKMKGCLRLLEKLEDLGEIRLPAKRVLKPQKSDIAWTTKTAPRREINGELSDVGKVRLEVVSCKRKKALWNEYVDRYHMLGFKKPFGCRIRYFIVSGGGDELGCILLAGAAKSMGVRDKWIGWSDEIRLKNLPWVVNNTRYLIFPWVRVKHLASHALGRLKRRVREDWHEHFGYRPLLLETFVDPAHFDGTSYRAAGWIYLGNTTGEGLRRPGRKYQTTPKMLFVTPLTTDFRERLCGELKGREAVE
jgi:hypothetical protein